MYAKLFYSRKMAEFAHSQPDLASQPRYLPLVSMVAALGWWSESCIFGNCEETLLYNIYIILLIRLPKKQKKGAGRLLDLRAFKLIWSRYFLSPPLSSSLPLSSFLLSKTDLGKRAPGKQPHEWYGGYLQSICGLWARVKHFSVEAKIKKPTKSTVALTQRFVKIH